MNHRNTFFKQLVVLSLFGSLVAFVGCAKSSGSFPLKTQPTGPSASVNPEEKPSLYHEDGVEVVRGGVHSENLKVTYDEVSRGMSVTGQLQVTPYDGGPLAVVDISLAGTLTDNRRISLKSSTGDKTPPDGMKIAAKATCIDQAGGCATSFVDIYVQYHDHIYHHQIETSTSEKTGTTTPYLPPIASKPDKLPTLADLDKEDDIAPVQHDDENEPIEEDDDSGAQQGQFIGDIKGDLKELFNVDPKPETQASPSPSPSVTTKPEETPAKPAEPTPEKKPEAKPEEKPATPVKTETPAPVSPKIPTVKPEPVKPEPAKPKPPVKEAPKPAPAKPEVKAPEVKPPVVKTPEPKTEPKPEPKPEVKPEPKPVTPEKPAETEKKEGPLAGLENISKKIYQVMGSANSGFLQNALNLFDLSKKKSQPGFYIARPELKTYFGSNETIYMIQKMANFTLTKVPGYSVRIGDLSKEHGGFIYTTSKGKQVKKHRSHTNGTDADISYYFKDPKDQGQSALKNGQPREDWMIDLQWELFKMFNQTKLVDRMFVHRKVKKALCLHAIAKGEITADMQEGLAFETLWRLQPRASDHDDHFHLRSKCSSIQQACRPMADPVRTTGCF